jgi:hypothetical protein
MRSESFFSVFGLDLDGCEHYPRVNFRSRAQSGILTPAFKLPTVVTRVLWLPNPLANWKLTL